MGFLSPAFFCSTPPPAFISFLPSPSPRPPRSYPQPPPSRPPGSNTIPPPTKPPSENWFKITPCPLFLSFVEGWRKPREHLREVPGAVDAQEPCEFTGQGGVANFPGMERCAVIGSSQDCGRRFSSFFFFPQFEQQCQYKQGMRNMYMYNTRARIDRCIYVYNSVYLDCIHTYLNYACT